VGATAVPTYLERLPAEVHRSLLDLGRRRSFARGAHLIYEGDGNDQVMVITSGWAKIATVSVNGEEVVLGLRGPGDLVGEMAAVDGPARPRSASVRSLTPLDATLIAASTFVEFLSAHPAGSLALLREFIQRLRETSSRAVRHGTLDVHHHLAVLLLDLAARVGEPGSERATIDLGLTQADLAGLLSCSRDSVAKALSQLRAEGLVETSRRSITVVSRSQLAQLGHRRI
jgi:CRP-like cAMP-binding protein